MHIPILGQTGTVGNLALGDRYIHFHAGWLGYGAWIERTAALSILGRRTGSLHLSFVQADVGVVRVLSRVSTFALPFRAG